MSKSKPSEIITLLDEFPLLTTDAKLYSEYIRIYNAIRAIQNTLLEPTLLVDVTQTKLSISAKAGRLYFVAQESVQYGDWVYISYVSGGLKKVAAEIAQSTWALPKNDTQPEFGMFTLPMFVTTPDKRNTGDIVEVATTGIVWVPQTLVPGTLYSLSGQRYVPRNLASTPESSVASGSAAGTWQSLNCMALSEHHIIIRRFN